MILEKSNINLFRRGSVRLEIVFATNTTETLNCGVCAEFPALMEVDQDRNVKYTRV